MRNAKRDFIEHTKDKIVKGAIINKFILKVNYNKDDYDLFLNQLDFDYGGCYDTMTVEGTIWYTDNTWSRIMEDYYLEWEYIELPEIPKELYN